MKNTNIIKEQGERTGVPFDPSTADGTGTIALPDRRSEKGIVLVVVLILSAVVLAIMTALIYMITSGTQVSGLQKRYKTSLDAARGGSEIFYQVIGLRGVTADDTTFMTALSNASLPSSLSILATTCSGVSVGGTPYSDPWQAKLMTPTASWTSCNSAVTIDPNDPTTYDMSVQMGATTKYNVYAKIVQTIEGNSGGDLSLYNKGVVSTGSGEIQVMPKPYLYDIEVMASNSTNTSERAKYSILYQY